ncbi:alpha/beta fold hydrolase [Homoserinibacter sp. GY 40078]|uniref:alpha/beta fold hydrolase n=1 Tax=Homoserinibacter sp. GY 40078 TaxID=2603275 RepID=UPI0011CBA538|nr:alpha/beta hydrolase [Homoserinibacter sp. GY 40078]TXK19776.1 alpha/beta fold hydrolase [Homoserinibacter sp. GY 40078]
MPPRPPRERRRRFRGTLFVTTHEQHASYTVAVTRMPGSRDSGPAFVMVHGLGVSSRYFRPVAIRLAERGSVFLVDLPGYGSAPDPRQPVSLDDHADALAAFLRETRLTEVVLVGHSMGSQVIATLAQNHPDLAGRMVLMAPTVEPERRSVRRAVSGLLHDTFREPPAVTWIAFTDYLLRTGPRYLLAQIPVVLDDALETRLGGVPGQLLLMRGSRDVLCSSGWVAHLAEVSGAPTVEVPGPHVVMYTDPDAVAEAIARHAVGGED